MQRKNDSTILILVAAGLGIYWYMKNKSNTAQVNPADQPLAETGFPPTGGTGVDYNPINNDLALFSPPNPSGGGGGNFDIFVDPVKRGGGTVTDMFNGLIDKSIGIDKNIDYEK
jgi:hypothetical protein